MKDVAQICPLYHKAIELVGKRWTGAIIEALMTGSRRFGELVEAVPRAARPPSLGAAQGTRDGRPGAASGAPGNAGAYPVRAHRQGPGSEKGRGRGSAVGRPLAALALRRPRVGPRPARLCRAANLS